MVFPAGEQLPHNGERDSEHGGDLAAARRLFPAAPEPFIDLSTGINPVCYPMPPLDAALFARLPSPAASAELAAVAASAYGAPSSAHVVPAPGTQILLPLVAALVPPGPALIVGPTYDEHARAAALAGHQVTEVGDLGAVRDAVLAVVTNPNNPDGRQFGRDALITAAQALRARKGILVIDEAFMDAAPVQESLASAVDCGNLVVLRSFGKFFGLAGVRLGFALSAPALARRLAALLGPWAVSAPALEIGTKALGDAAWIAQARQQLPKAAARLGAILTASGLDITGGTALFRLVRLQSAAALFDHLGRAGILTRRFSKHPAWLRFGLPGAEPEWQRLQRAMAAFRA